MAGNRVRLSADLDDNVSSKLSKIRDHFDMLGGKGTAASLFGNIGANVAAGAIGLVSGAATQLIGKLDDAQAAFREDEASQTRLRASLAANVPSYKGNTDAIEKVLASRMRLGFSDDEQRASLAQLVTRTKDSSKAMEIQATAMDLARLKGISLESATNLLGKAYSGNVGALVRAGIAVDKTATATEALAAVQKAAKGQAEAFANTSGGKLVASQIRVGESMERVGLVVAKISDFAIPILADAFETVVNVVGEVAAAIQKFVSENKGLINVLATVAGIVGNVLGGAFGILSKAAGDAFAMVSDVIGAISDVIKGVASSIIGTIRNIVGVAAEIPGPWQESAAAVKATLSDMQASVDGWGKSTSAGAGKAADDIVANTTTGLAGGAAMVGDAAEEGLGEPIDTAVKKAAWSVKARVQNLPGQIATALLKGRSEWLAAWETFTTDTDTAMSRAAEIGSIKAKLAGKAIAAGLASGDPDRRTATAAIVAQLEERLGELRSVAYTRSTQAGDDIARGLRNTRAGTKEAADLLTLQVKNSLGVLPSQAYGWGASAGREYAIGITSKTTDVATAAAALARKTANYLQLQSPAKEGPLSEGGPQTWGEKLGSSFAEGMTETLPAVTAAASKIAAAASLAKPAATYKLGMDTLVQALSGRRGAIEGAAGAVADATWDPQINKAKQTLNIMALQNEELLANMKSGDLQVRLQAEIEFANLMKDKERLRGAVKSDNQLGQAELEVALRQRRQTIKDSVGDKLADAAHDWGASFTRKYANGLKSEADYLQKVAARLARTVSDYLKTSSPAKEGPLSLGGGPEGWGARLGDLFGAGMQKATDAVAGGASSLAAAAMPTLGEPAYAGTGASLGGGNVTVQVNFTSIATPSPSDGQRIAAAIGPELQRWMRTNQLTAA